MSGDWSGVDVGIQGVGEKSTVGRRRKLEDSHCHGCLWCSFGVDVVVGLEKRREKKIRQQAGGDTLKRGGAERPRAKVAKR